jgi:hypothetical protein
VVCAAESYDALEAVIAALWGSPAARPAGPAWRIGIRIGRQAADPLGLEQLATVVGELPIVGLLADLIVRWPVRVLGWRHTGRAASHVPPAHGVCRARG